MNVKQERLRNRVQSGYYCATVGCLPLVCPKSDSVYPMIIQSGQRQREAVDYVNIRGGQECNRHLVIIIIIIIE